MRGTMKIDGQIYYAYSRGSKKMCDEVAAQLREEGYKVSVRRIHPLKTRQQFCVYVVPNKKLMVTLPARGIAGSLRKKKAKARKKR